MKNHRESPYLQGVESISLSTRCARSRCTVRDTQIGSFEVEAPNICETRYISGRRETRDREPRPSKGCARGRHVRSGTWAFGTPSNRESYPRSKRSYISDLTDALDRAPRAARLVFKTLFDRTRIIIGASETSLREAARFAKNGAIPVIAGPRGSLSGAGYLHGRLRRPTTRAMCDSRWCL